MSFQDGKRVGFSSGASNYIEQKYNELFHITEIYLDNSGSFDKSTPATKYNINPAAILNLTISNNLLNWVTEGSMVIMYLPDDSPRTGITGQAAADNGNVLKNFQFRNDGMDLLRVMITPKITKDQNKNNLQIDSNDPKWTLSYMFSVYDTEDVVDIPSLNFSNSLYMRCLKLYFRDVRYELLKMTNLEYSTASSIKAVEEPQLANGSGGPRVTTTGQALREVFEKALGDTETGGSPDLFQYPGQENWDDGKSLLFYTSPADYSAAEDIDYLFSHHVSSKQLQGAQDANDFCLLYTKRPRSNEYIEDICLAPVSNFFEKATNGNNAGELQLEHFFVTSHTQEKSLVNLYKAPMSNQDGVDLITNKYGQITSYSFVDMATESNTELFATKPVYSVDIGKRTFNIRFTNNDVETARSAIAETYISKMYHNNGSNNEQLFLPVLHKRKKNLNIFPQFSLNGDNEVVMQRNGIHNLLYTGLFHNACISFKTLGLTLRQPGSFIGIDKVGGSGDGDYNNKLFGQWFVIRVDHMFEAGAYVNVIYAIKTHRFKKISKTFQEVL